MLTEQPPISHKACPKCDLMTPGWRKQCIHCGKTITHTTTPADAQRARTQEHEPAMSVR